MVVGFWFLGNQGNDCNFEAGICKWTFDSKGKFNWTRHKGSTGTTGTGPKFDHTFGNTGLFHVVVVVVVVVVVTYVLMWQVYMKSSCIETSTSTRRW